MDIVDLQKKDYQGDVRAAMEDCILRQMIADDALPNDDDFLEIE